MVKKRLGFSGPLSFYTLSSSITSASPFHHLSFPLSLSLVRTPTPIFCALFLLTINFCSLGLSHLPLFLHFDPGLCGTWEFLDLAVDDGACRRDESSKKCDLRAAELYKKWK